MRLFSEWARGLRATAAIKYWHGSYSLDVDGFARHLNPAPDGRCLRTLGAVLHLILWAVGQRLVQGVTVG